MIKIIKQGKTKRFEKTCPSCDCEFEYEASDLITDYSVCLTTYPPKYNTYVVCPCCGRRIYHGTTQEADLTIASPKLHYTDTQYTYDCNKCPNRPDLNKITVGDTSCTWCKKRQPYCFSGTVSCTSASYTVDPKDLWATTSAADSDSAVDHKKF